MKEFQTSTRFRVRDEQAFNNRVKELINDWNEYRERYDRDDINPVEMAMGEALRDPELAEIVFVCKPKRFDIARCLAGWRSEQISPEMFRAMFEEGATC
ncbi:MAG TPA: hypothetical protein PLS25_02995 [Methanoregulaceae archaeon]|nr:hypothetical protein [Methanoregulaceae archaeon]